MRYLPLLIALAACDKSDVDDDGYLPPVDCNDVDENIHPDADEVCDGVDNNCDGNIDENPTEGPTWYQDEDGDGAGGDDTKIACEQPDGYVDTQTDCDDEDDSVFPGADELCNGVDDDCDGTVDPDTSVDAKMWYADGDKDGYGAGEGAPACDNDGGVLNDDDCDDTDDTINPDGFELCDSVDNDCDGVADDGNTEPTDYFPDADEDGFGATGEGKALCGQPDGWLTDAADCDDVNDAVNPDADEVCDEIDNDCDGETDPPTAVDATTWFDDLDGDGVGVGEGFLACFPEGAAPEGGDCDDEDDHVRPGVPDICSEGVDRNCDEVFDGCDVCHPFEPVSDVAWEKTFNVTYDGSAGSELQEGLGGGTTSQEIDGFAMHTVLNAGAHAWDAKSYTACDEGGALLQLESAGTYNDPQSGQYDLIAVDNPARQVLPPVGVIGDHVTWTFSYSLDVQVSGYPVEIPTEGTSTEAGYDTITVPAGTFEALRIDSTYSQDFSMAYGSVVERESSFWYVEGLGLIKEETTDPSDGHTVILKELASYEGL